MSLPDLDQLPIDEFFELLAAARVVRKMKTHDLCSAIQQALK